jgi:hypothetical protein
MLLSYSTFEVLFIRERFRIEPMISLLTSSSSSLATRLTLLLLDGLDADEGRRCGVDVDERRCGDGDEIFFIFSLYLSLSIYLSVSLSRQFLISDVNNQITSVDRSCLIALVETDTLL